MKALIPLILKAIVDFFVGVFNKSMETPAKTTEVKYEESDEVKPLGDDYYDGKYGL